MDNSHLKEFEIDMTQLKKWTHFLAILRHLYYKIHFS